MIHKLKLDSRYLSGSFDQNYEPVHTINSGDSLHLTTPDIQWGYSPNEDTPKTFYKSNQQEEKPGHPMIGPIAVNGAKAGNVLEVRLNDIVPGWYGENWAGGGPSWQNQAAGISEEEKIQLDWHLNNTNLTGSCRIGDRSFHVGLSPFMGLMGTSPKEPGTHDTPPPRYSGGNIDCKELVKGSTLYLPISVDDAHFYIGDGHALQGDGEISGTAIECPMDHVDVTLTVRDDMTLTSPLAKTPSGWITFGFNEDLNVATGEALSSMITLMEEQYGIKKTEAMALASTVVDLRITQVVNGVKGVHAMLAHGALRG
ncbi:acetamidase/formamidase family protein [Bacillus sp. H-16]|uniref:acetamidase/formamidase family protein n=1 Tax=Alteribacter salitolerans TaxID=2912333 RepID=UPI001963F43E|nr:acetamidase/formamidase family protein [Alteribacter salitolerans]MBM7095746.1 acetamidase/formamidase family protein [Alteribacter salitolerans]